MADDIALTFRKRRICGQVGGYTRAQGYPKTSEMARSQRLALAKKISERSKLNENKPTP